MPESGAKTQLLNKGKSHQSAWLTHWSRTMFETDHLSQLSRGEENDGIEMSSDNFGLHEKLTSDSNVSRECHLQPTDQVKYHMFFSESSYLPAENIRHPTTSFASKDHLPGEKSKMLLFCRQNNAAHLKTNPSSSSHRSLYFVEEQYKRMQKHIGTGFFSNHTDSPQNVVHDVEMTKMSGGLHCFSRTAHRLLLTKQTDVKVYQSVKELNCYPTRFGEAPQGVTLQLLDSSHQESQENVEYCRGVKKNESHSNTNAESFKENKLSDVRLLPTNKDIIVNSNMESINRSRKRKMDLSNTNLDISTLPADASSSAEKPEPCMSRTQSLDMNTQHYTLNQTTNSTSNECSNSNRSPQPGTRWIKRLKLQAETSSSSHGKPEIQTAESSSLETKQECCWIQRWSQKHKQNQKTDETSNVTTDEYKRNQFPSIAALALMGKAMTGLPQF